MPTTISMNWPGFMTKCLDDYKTKLHAFFINNSFISNAKLRYDLK